MFHAVIMAGGAGTRFWPESRGDSPKQLLKLLGEESMIQATVRRLGQLVSPERTMVVTNQALVPAIVQQLPDLPRSAVIGEPCKRDTAPCIGLAAALVLQADPEATMAVMPADHVITPAEAFQAALQQAAQLVEVHPERIVTFGISPTYPAESFGYIERGEALDPDAGPGKAPVFRVEMFREKPTAEVAEQYLSSGGFYWNSGIFVWKARTIVEALRRFEPQMYARLQTIAEAASSPQYEQVLQRQFADIEAKSIDYAVMEQYEDVAVIEAPYQWDDVGSWQSLTRLHGTDDYDNTILGKHLGLNTTGCIVRGDQQHLIVTVGLKDCIVVHTPDATLVARKRDEESVREVVRKLKEKGWNEYL